MSGDSRPNEIEAICPIRKTKHSVGSAHIYDLSLRPELLELSQKLVIDWGPGYRRWDQHADKQNKPIIEIRRHEAEPPFPGYNRFMHRLGDLETIWPSWKTKLSECGVYLLSFNDGQQYVGSATSLNGGFWQRWQDYFKNGHGGNVVLKGRDARLAQVSILETARLSDSRNDILEIEYLWQKKLGTRAKRLGDGNEIPPDS